MGGNILRKQAVGYELVWTVLGEGSEMAATNLHFHNDKEFVDLFKDYAVWRFCLVSSQVMGRELIA